MSIGQYMAPLTAERDFYPFYGIYDQKTQFTVKNVEVENLIKVGTSFKTVIASRHTIFKETPVSAQTIVGNVGEVMDGTRDIGDLHATVD